ncbi:MAG TPA: hypothetical protein VMV81_03090 [Phycisphaerae bacterium]|nr:hypothetical protein [Phycisphaerae bacterium]
MPKRRARGLARAGSSTEAPTGVGTARSSVGIRRTNRFADVSVFVNYLLADNACT